MLPPVTSGSVSGNSVRDRLQVGLRVAMKAGDKASMKAFRCRALGNCKLRGSRRY